MPRPATPTSKPKKGPCIGRSFARSFRASKASRHPLVRPPTLQSVSPGADPIDSGRASSTAVRRFRDIRAATADTATREAARRGSTVDDRP